MHLSPMSKVDLAKRFLAIVLLASLAPCQVARAQEPLHIPKLRDFKSRCRPKVSPISAPAIESSAYANLSTAKALRDAVQGGDTPHS